MRETADLREILNPDTCFTKPPITAESETRRQLIKNTFILFIIFLCQPA